MFCFLNGITVKCLFFSFFFFFEIVALYYWLVDPGVPMFFLKYHKGGTWEEKRKEGKNFSDINVLIKLCVFFKKKGT